MAHRFEVLDQTTSDAGWFLYYLNRGTEKEIILGALRQQKRRTKDPRDEISILQEIMKNTEKRNDAEWDAKRISEDYDDCVIIAAPATHVTPTPPEEVTIVEGRIASIDFKRARLGIQTTAGRVSVTYADIVQKPYITYPSVEPAVEIDFPTRIVTDSLPPFS